MFLKWDEVYIGDIGDGVLDYDTYLKRLNSLSPHTSCYCKHLPDERDYALNIDRVKHFAQKTCVRFLPRKAT